jgi:hypothetical protein
MRRRYMFFGVGRLKSKFRFDEGIMDVDLLLRLCDVGISMMRKGN